MIQNRGGSGERAEGDEEGEGQWEDEGDRIRKGKGWGQKETLPLGCEGGEIERSGDGPSTESLTGVHSLSLQMM